MLENIYQSKEDWVYDQIKSYPWFKSTDLIELMNSERMGYLYLKRWVENGRVKKYPFHIYSPVNSRTGEVNVNLHEALCQLDESTYLSEFTAARFHGLTVPEDGRIYLATKKRFRELMYDDWNIKYKSYLLVENCETSGFAKYSSYTQTVLDVIKAFPGNMSWEELIVFMTGINRLETSRCLKVLESIHNKNLNKKMGWLVDGGFVEVDNKVALIEYCFDQIPKTKLVFGPKAGVYNERWRLLEPGNPHVIR